MNYTKKAGCILLNLETKKVALVYREQYNDYTFPKGHLEENETLEECALRETAEETKRDALLLEKEPIYIEHYETPENEKVEVVYYLAKDIGKSGNTSEETHPTFWYSPDEVYEKLSYEGLKKIWNNVTDKIKNYMEKC